VLARALLQGRSAEDVAGALVRLYRARLPAPEEIAVLPPAAGARREQAPRRDGGGEPTVWFSLNLGRAQKADPKWLVPLICRLGGVEKREIGAIRILDRETRFQILPESAEDFFARWPTDGKEARIARSEAPAAAPRRDGFAQRRSGKPGTPKAGGGKTGASVSEARRQTRRP